MKRIVIYTLALVMAVSISGLLAAPAQAGDSDVIRYAGSNQIYKAFDKDLINAFTRDTGVQVKAKPSSSGSAFYRLVNGDSDVAAIARKLYRTHEDYGYVQIPFCKDPLAVITNCARCEDNLTESQAQDIFSGDIRNWKEVGGEDLPIMVVVPGRDTAANKNFRRQIMKHKEISYTFSAYDSTMAIRAVKSLPEGAISFIANGAVVYEKGIKILKIDGKHPGDSEYPYYQIFYYVTKGKPQGSLKAFVDLAFSKKGKDIMQHNGMLPLPKPY